jgi:hypothetical protein
LPARGNRDRARRGQGEFLDARPTNLAEYYDVAQFRAFMRDAQASGGG